VGDLSLKEVKNKKFVTGKIVKNKKGTFSFPSNDL
jgi:hypothetical protein